MTTQRIEDEEGREIVVGTKVMYGAPPDWLRKLVGPPEGELNYRATVIEIGEFDVDYDDDLGRARLFPPKVTIRFDGSDETEIVSTSEVPARLTWADYPDGPAVYAFCADDLEVLPDK